MERRTFLALGAAVVGLAGCTSDASEPVLPSAPATSPAPSDPDARTREEVAAAELALIAAYRSAIAANPEHARDLEPFLVHHEQHLARVAPRLAASAGSPPPAAASASASAASSTSDAPAESAESTPNESPAPSAGNALAELAAAESAAQTQRATSCDGVSDPMLARDLCLIAASEAQHAAVLADLVARESES